MIINIISSSIIISISISIIIIITITICCLIIVQITITITDYNIWWLLVLWLRPVRLLRFSMSEGLTQADS